MGFGSGSHCLYVRVRNENVVSMQGRASQRQTGRSGLAAESVLGPVRWPVRVSLFCELAWDRARAEGWIIYQVQEGLCLALGLPMISFPTDHTVPNRAGVFSSPSQVGTAGGWSVVGCRVRRGKEGLLTLCRWADAVVCSAPTGLGRLAGQLSGSLSGRPLELPWSLPSQPRFKTKLGPRAQVQVSFGASNRIRSGWIREERRGPFFVDPLFV